MPLTLGDDDGGIAMFRRSRSAGVEPVVVLEARDDPRRDTGEQDRLEVDARSLVRGEVREDAGVEDGKQAGQLGVRVVRDELRIVLRLGGVPEVLLARSG